MIFEIIDVDNIGNDEDYPNNEETHEEANL